MRPRIVMLLAFVIAAVAVGFTGARFTIVPSPAPAIQKTLPQRADSYLGVFEPGAPPSYQPIEEFAEAAGREPNLIGYYSGWAEPFATSFAEMVYRHGLIPFVQIDPTLASISAIATGAYDVYLDTYADAVRDFGHQVVIGFGHEMNSKNYPWGYGTTSPSTFIAAWRHIVTLFRSHGADNVTWLWTLEADSSTTGPAASWWPGPSYVDWVGIDGYYYSPTDTFSHVFAPTINAVRAFTDKPVLLSETAVTRSANQYANIVNLFEGMAKYKALGLVWFDKDQLEQIERRDWRIEGDVQAEAAFRASVSRLKLVSTGPH